MSLPGPHRRPVGLPTVMMPHRQGREPAARRAAAGLDAAANDSASRDRVEPLIGGTQVFPALERAIAQAGSEVLMAYWTFDPDMPLVSEVRDSGVETWAELLTARALDGVDVRILMTDFDPILGHRFHHTTFRNYLALAKARRALPAQARDRFQVVVSRHPARTGGLVETAMRPLTWARLRALCGAATADGDDETGLDWLRASPGLWPHVTVEAGGVRPRPWRRRPIYPAVHHEKSCIVDRQTGFVGGLDIDQKRFDTPYHRAEDAWHDVTCRVGPRCAGVLASHFAELWNESRAPFHRFLETQQPPAGIDRLPYVPASPMRTGPAPEPDRPGSRPRILRTRSVGDHRFWSRAPRLRDGAFLQAYLDLIGQADRLLYLESQFFRSAALADAIADRARLRPDLEVILLIPLVPDLMADTSDPNAASRHGHWLQRRAVRRLRSRLGHRFGVFTLIRNGPAPEGCLPHAMLHGSDQVYVHSKVAIADDRTAIVGSANLNGRSLRMDTETGVVWHDADGIRRFRESLWQAHFGPAPELEDAPYLPAWRDLAGRNRDLRPGERRGFVVPVPDRSLSHQARRNILVPSHLV